MSPRVAILWHLHQPEYRDPTTGVPTMPWTRLHMLRGVRDLVVELAEQRLPFSIDLVPIMLEQMVHYAEGGSDPHLDLTRVPVEALTDDQRAAIRATFVAGHPAMVEASDAWSALASRVQRGALLTTDAWRDVQVWSTLAWFGATARRDFPILEMLIAKGSGFSPAEKASMLDVQQQVLETLPGLLDRLPPAGVTVAGAPYYHPILPLLCDLSSAGRSTDTPPDRAFAAPDHAQWHLTEGRASVTACLGGVAPRGVWPSEGSVSPEIVPLVAKAGYRWLASDDGVLYRSERTSGEGGGPWDLGHGVVGFFRDHELSDRIGFRYATMDPHQAVDDLVAGVASRSGDLVVLILDGENPWESFADAGHAFRHALYTAVRQGRLQLVGLDEAAEESPVGMVTTLHSGSWIGANFNIWAGHPEDHAAWDLLADAVEAARGHEHEALARPHLFAAEGSDWFWWYGDDFSTPFKPVFDTAFRSHLKAAWRALGQEPPEALFSSLVEGDTNDLTPPRARSPICWETAWHWVCWADAGSVSWPRSSAMAGGTGGLPPARWVRSEDGAVWLHTRLPLEGSVRVEVCDEVLELSPSTATVAGAQVTVSRQPGALTLEYRGTDPASLVVWDRDGGRRFPIEGALSLPKRLETGLSQPWDV